MSAQVSERRDMGAGVAAACFGAGLLAMAVLQWHIAERWIDLYSQYPLAGFKSAVVAKMPPDFLMSELSRALAQALVGVVSLIAMLVFPGRALLPAVCVLAGAWTVTEGSILFTPGVLSSNLGPLAPLVHFILSAIYLSVGMIAGALPGAGINWLRARLSA